VERVEEEQEKKEDRGGESVTCPLSKVHFKHCDWRGPPRTLKHHVLERHTDVSKRVNSFECRGVANRVLLIFYQADMFLYFKYITNTGHMYIFVQQVGLTHGWYICKVRIASQDKSTEDIDTRFRVNSITETFEKSAETGKCVEIDVRQMKYFVRHHKIDMVVTIQ
jgi:hypothetical protein